MPKQSDPIQKVVLICPKFFNYEISISEEIEKQNMEVLYFDERPSNSSLNKVLIRLGFKSILKNKVNAYYENIFSKLIVFKPDVLFIIDIEVIPRWFIEKVKHAGVKVVLYMWDSYNNKGHFSSIIDLCDKSFTFDLKDANKFEEMQFLPLFYEQKFISKNGYECRKNDIGFVGSFHSDRYKVVSSILRQVDKANQLKVFTYFYSPNRFVLFFRVVYLFIRFGTFLKDYNSIYFKGLSKEQVYDFYKDTKVVVDVHHPGQTGLTARTFEALASGCKLITTNSNIKQYDFYDPSTIFIVEKRQKIGLRIPIEFVQESFSDEMKVLNEKLQKYSLENWVKNIIGSL